MASTELEKATKQEMGYTEDQRTCEFCKFKRPMKTGIDRDFRDECSFSNLCQFEVRNHGSCKYFEHKPK